MAVSERDPLTVTDAVAGDKVLSVGAAGVEPSVVNWITGARPVLQLVFDAIAVTIKSSVSPDDITTVSLIAIGTVFVSDVGPSMEVVLCLIWNVTPWVPDAAYKFTDPLTRAVPPEGAVHRNNDPTEVPGWIPPGHIPWYACAPFHNWFAELYVIGVPFASR